MKKTALIGLVGIAIISAAMLGCRTIGNIVDTKRVEIKSQISMPLFYTKSGTKADGIVDTNTFMYQRYFSQCEGLKDVKGLANIDGTWDYLAKSESDRKRCREAILETCKNGETPAITFCLSAQAGNTSFAGKMWNNATFPNVDADGLKEVTDLIKELCREGIAVFPCLYSDGGGPSWTKIGNANVMAGWKTVNDSIGQYVTGYVLSIESNEEAQSLDQLQKALAAMRTAMPGVPFMGTHMQFHKRSNPPRHVLLDGSLQQNYAKQRRFYPA